MKRRLLSCLALLLLAAMLLCSCAEGLPGSALFFAAKDAGEKYVTQLKLLQGGAKVLVADGKSDYTLSLNRASSAGLKTAVAELRDHIQNQTGVRLSENADGTQKQIRIVLSDELSAPVALSASQFYIGFSGNDLLIQANNEPMLISAVSYFIDTYLQNVQDGKLYLSPDLSFISPCAEYKAKEHFIIYAEQSGTGATQAINRLCNALVDTANVRLTTKSDFTGKAGAADILFGYPDDKDAQDILSNLSYNDFYIGVRNGKLMILAPNDATLNEATDFFISHFITAPDATFNQETQTVSLPAICHYYHRGNAILLAQGGINHAVLVHPENPSGVVQNAIKQFTALYKRLTNTTLDIYSEKDYVAQTDMFEIRLTFPDSLPPSESYLQTLPRGQWVFSLSSDQRSLLLVANGHFAMNSAINALSRALSAQTIAISREMIENDWQITPDTNRTLFIPRDLSETEQDAPDFSVSSTVATYRNTHFVMESKAIVTEEIYKSYHYRLLRLNFVLISKQTRDGVTSTLYQNDDRTLLLRYDPTKQTMQLQSSDRPKQ